MTKKSTGEYPPNWWMISLEVKNNAHWECIRCGHPDSWEDHYVLTVHHLDMNKSNCEWWNLVALCQRCHLRIQGKVDMRQYYMFDHSEWFRPYVAGYRAHLEGKPTDYETVLGTV